MKYFAWLHRQDNLSHLPPPLRSPEKLANMADEVYEGAIGIDLGMPHRPAFLFVAPVNIA